MQVLFGRGRYLEGKIKEVKLMTRIILEFSLGNRNNKIKVYGQWVTFSTACVLHTSIACYAE